MDKEPEEKLISDGILMYDKKPTIIPIEQAWFEVIVNEIQELKRRVVVLESKLQGDSK